MPKERHHLLLADEALKSLTRSGALRPFSLQERHAYWLGALWPDHLFYDLPTFTMKRVGRALHVLERPGGLSLLKSWIGNQDDISGEAEAWVLGLTCHFLADHYWHPAINRFCRPPFAPCAARGLTPGDCHHYIESNLEAVWLDRRGPSDGYLALLAGLPTEGPLVDALIPRFHSLLDALEAPLLPHPRRLKRCLRWQNRLMRLFAQDSLAKKRRLLLRYRSTQPLGVLVVPNLSELNDATGECADRLSSLGTLVDPIFFDETVSSSASRLLELPIRWR
ncbi:MAG: zinc dependent phospholipase C family protein [Syntrophobacteraceae bacterium]